jgi:hypothetical protein
LSFKKRKRELPKALVCDFDGTLFEFPLYQQVHFTFLRLIVAGIFSSLPAFLQAFFARPTKFLKKVKVLYLAGVKIIIVSSRRNSPRGVAKIRYLLKSQGIEPEKIFLRPPNFKQENHKLQSLSKIKAEYEIIGIAEDNKSFHQSLKQFGPILDLDL